VRRLNLEWRLCVTRKLEFGMKDACLLSVVTNCRQRSRTFWLTTPLGLCGGEQDDWIEQVTWQGRHKSNLNNLNWLIMRHHKILIRLCLLVTSLVGFRICLVMLKWFFFFRVLKPSLPSSSETHYSLTYPLPVLQFFFPSPLNIGRKVNITTTERISELYSPISEEVAC
jgi:hypothetical protein